MDLSNIYSSPRDTWMTPLQLLEGLGTFDLDPCAGDFGNFARINWRINDGQDALILPWAGSVWLNPPFSAKRLFLPLFVANGNGVCINPCPATAKWWQNHVKACGVTWIPPYRVQYIDPLTGKPAKNGSAFGSSLHAIGQEKCDLLLTKARKEGGLIL